MKWIGLDDFGILTVSYLLIIGWCALVMEITVPSSGKKRQRLAGWCILYLTALSIGIFHDMVTRAVGVMMTGNKTLGGMSLTFAAGCFILMNSMEILIPVLAAGAGYLVLYGKSSAVQRFMAIFSGVWAMIVNEFIFQTALVPFLRAEEGQRQMSMPPFAVREGIRLAVFVIAFLCYRRFFSGRIKVLLSEGRECLDRFVKVMLAALVLFLLMTAILPTYSISFQASRLQARLLWIETMGMMTGINAILYWSFFTAIQVSVREMKTRAELEVASRIQCSVLPQDDFAPDIDSGFFVCGDMAPAREVGGDFYDYFLHEDGRLVAVIGDVSGKGVPAALFMMSARTLIRAWGKRLQEPGQVLEAVNQELAENNQEGMFVTVFLCMYDWKSGALTYSNGGHNPPYVCKKDGGAARLLVKPGFVLAGMEGFRYITQQSVLGEGEKLILYTDGVTEAMDEKENLFGEKRLEEALDGAGAKDAAECLRSVKTAVKTFAGEAEQSDDITVVVLERKPR